MISLQNPEKGFEVNAGTLSFSVIVYTTCAIAAVATILARRFLPVFGQAELGGTKTPKWICSAFFLILWFLYIILSALQAYGHIENPLA